MSVIRTSKPRSSASTHTAEDGFDLLLAGAAVESLRDALLTAGAQAVNDDVSETLRIEAGIALYGIDMDD